MHAFQDGSGVLTAVFRAVLQASWQGSLAIGLVLLVRRLCGARVPARWHHLLWFPVVARLLVPGSWLPHSPASLENVRAVSRPFEGAVTGGEPERPARPTGAAAVISLPAATPEQPRERAGAWRSPVFWRRWAAQVWLGGAAGLAGWLAGCSWYLHGRLRREGGPADEDVQALWERCCERWLRRPAPRLRAVGWVRCPALVGWGRPILLVPRAAPAAFSPLDWEHVFAHEIAHLRRRDHWSQALALAAWGVHWFNPVVWLGYRRLCADRELAADEWVLKRLEDSRAPAYGETLFKALAGRSARFAIQPGLVGLSEDGAQIKQRLQSIAAFLPGQRWAGSLAGLALVLVLATVVLGQEEKAEGRKMTGASPTGKGSGAEAELPPALPRNLADLPPEACDAVWELSLQATKAGDIGTIEALLDRGLDPNVNLENSSSLLFNAVDDNQLAIVKLLLAHGANVLAKTSWGDVPLQRACWRGHKAVADTLIQAGAPVNELPYDTGMGDVAALAARDQRQPITDKEARDNLFFAVASGHPDTFELLWKKLGPMPEADRDKLLGDLYENAGKWGHANLLPVLEARGASPARDGSRALVHAAGLNYPATVKALLERGVSPNVTPPRWGNLLREAAGGGRIEVMRLLLDHGADTSVRDSEGYTPLAWAAYSGEEPACLLLLDHGADGSIVDNDGQNAAWHAAGGPHCDEALARMIKAGVSVTGQDNEGHGILYSMMHFATPQSWHGAFFMKVYSAADMQRFDERERRVIDLLADAGVDLNGPAGGPVPLVEAMQSQHYVGALELLQRGADAARTDKNGVTPLYELVSYTPRDRPLPLELLKALVERGGSPGGEITVPNVTPPTKTSALEEVIGSAARNTAGGHSYQEGVRIMLDAGGKFPGVADANVQDLLQGAARGNLAAVQESVAQGAAADAADGDGWDALTVATALGYDDCAAWLLDHGADVSGKNHAEWNWASPLTFAVQRNRADLVDRMLAHGAKADDDPEALYEAVEHKNERIFEALLRAGADPKREAHYTLSTGGKTFRPPESFALFLCIRDGLTGMGTALLDHGAEAEPANLRDGRSLVHWAVFYGRPEILRALLDHGANPVSLDDQGETPLGLARKSHPELAAMLEAASQRRDGAGKGR